MRDLSNKKDRCLVCMKLFEGSPGVAASLVCQCSTDSYNKFIEQAMISREHKESWLKERRSAQGIFSPWVIVSPTLCFRHNVARSWLVSVSSLGNYFYVLPNMTKYFREVKFARIGDACEAFDEWACKHGYALETPHECIIAGSPGGVAGMKVQDYKWGVE